MFLKVHSSGKLRITKKQIQIIKSELEYKSDRSVLNNLKRLKEYNFIGYNVSTGYYFIRGFDKIRIIYGFTRRTAVYLYTSDLKRLKSFLVGALITNLIYKQEGRVKAAERKQGRSNHTASSPPFQIANSVLAKILDISLSTASLYKRNAHDAGYITITKNFVSLPINYRAVHLFRKSNPEIRHKLIVIDKNVYRQEPDLVSTNMELKRRKKIDTYI
jgi:hypothetical protein